MGEIASGVNYAKMPNGGVTKPIGIKKLVDANFKRFSVFLLIQNLLYSRLELL